MSTSVDKLEQETKWLLCMICFACFKTLTLKYYCNYLPLWTVEVYLVYPEKETTVNTICCIPLGKGRKERQDSLLACGLAVSRELRKLRTFLLIFIFVLWHYNGPEIIPSEWGDGALGLKGKQSVKRDTGWTKTSEILTWANRERKYARENDVPWR